MLTKKQLHNELYYDRSTGEFFRINTSGLQFKYSPVGCVGNNGYIVITLNKEKYMAHHLVMMYEYGIKTDLVIDHIDGNPSNNKRENLRAVTPKVNMKNKALNRNNKTGINGVQLINGRYCCWIGNEYLGSTLSKGNALSISERAKLDRGYHKGHGLRPPISVTKIKKSVIDRSNQCYRGGYENIDHLLKIRKIRGAS